MKRHFGYRDIFFDTGKAEKVGKGRKCIAGDKSVE